MSDQNQFEAYKQKLLHYWGLFLAACGRLWEQVKIYARKAAAFLRRSGRNIVRKLAEWLLLAREKVGPAIHSAGEWLASVPEGIRSFLNERAARRQTAAAALPATEEVIVEAEPVETAALPVEVAEAAAEEAPKTEPAPQPAARQDQPAAVFAAIGAGFRTAGKWIARLYKFVMAAPVVWFAVKFAAENMDRLPEEVGLDIQATGEFARMISRTEAVYWPLGITAFCLLLMFFAKKPILPWVISIFSLVLPQLIWLLNFYA